MSAGDPTCCAIVGGQSLLLRAIALALRGLLLRAIALALRGPPLRIRPFSLCYSQTMKLGVTEYADCAHFLPGHPKCGAIHGHTYKIELTIEGQIKGGMVVDFADLKQSLRE